MVTLLTVTHVVVCVFLIIIVLLQHGKGADMGASFGGGSGQTVFGTDGPLPLLNKITTASAIIFMVTSVTLAYYSANMSKGSIMKDVRIAPISTEQQVEATPTTVEVPMTRSNTEGGQDATDPANATFPGDANATFPGEKSTDPIPVPVEGSSEPATEQEQQN